MLRARRVPDAPSCSPLPPAPPVQCWGPSASRACGNIGSGARGHHALRGASPREPGGHRTQPMGKQIECARLAPCTRAPSLRSIAETSRGVTANGYPRKNQVFILGGCRHVAATHNAATGSSLCAGPRLRAGAASPGYRPRVGIDEDEGGEAACAVRAASAVAWGKCQRPWPGLSGARLGALEALTSTVGVPP